MPVDFSTALARLLRDGALRDQFALDPEKVVSRLEIAPEDAAALLAFPSKDIEYQALILLRKRFDACQGFFPITRANLGADAIALFADYARLSWPTEPGREMKDAQDFLDALGCVRPQAVDPSDIRRLSFLRGSRRFSLFWGPILLARGKRTCALHVLLRTRKGRVRAWAVHLGL